MKAQKTIGLHDLPERRERERERGHEDSTQCRSHSIAQCYEEWAVLTPNY